MFKLSLFLATLLSSVICALAYSTPPSGAITIGKNGKYSTISAALKDTSSKTYFVYSGSYKETVIITRSGIKVKTNFIGRLNEWLRSARRFMARRTWTSPTQTTVRTLLDEEDVRMLTSYYRSCDGHQQ
jgi:hypothetical protein